MTEKKIAANFKHRADAERALERLEALGARDLEICEAQGLPELRCFYRLS